MLSSPLNESLSLEHYIGAAFFAFKQHEADNGFHPQILNPVGPICAIGRLFFEQSVGNSAMFAGKGYLALTARNFRLQCSDAGFKFRNRKGINILLHKIIEWVVPA
jgi:hypothetical protein